MVMEQNFIKIRVYFKGLYEWGEGWNTEAHIKWREFWKNYRGGIWRYVRVDDEEHLISVSNNIYLHPYITEIVLQSNGVKTNGSYFDLDIKMLKELFTECAEYCGGSMSMEISQEVTNTFIMQDVD